MISKKILAAGTVLVFALTMLTGCSRSDDKAPNFKLRSLSGREVSLDQFKGKVVLLDFWATWCGPCRMTMPLLENIQKEYSKRMTLLAINLQEPDSVVRDYVRRQNMDSEVLLDEDGTVGRAYGADAIPMQVLIDRQGTIRYAQSGFSGTFTRLRAEIEKLQQ